MKKFGLGDHRFDPNVTLHLSNKGFRLCNDLTFSNFRGGDLYTMSEDYCSRDGDDPGIDGEVEYRLNGRLCKFTDRQTRHSGEKQYPSLTDLLDSFEKQFDPDGDF